MSAGSYITQVAKDQNIKIAPHLKHPELITFSGRVYLYMKDFAVGTTKTIIAIAVVYLSVNVMFVKHTAEALKIVCFVPIIEEFMFRGGLQKVIWLGEVGVRRIQELTGKNFTTNNRCAIERKLRVVVTGVFFGLAHAFNTHSTLVAKAFQVIHSTLGGIEYGALLEETNTMAYGILFHALNNGIAIMAMVGTIWATAAIAAVIFLDLSLLYVASHGVEQTKVNIKNLFSFKNVDFATDLKHLHYQYM